MIGVYYCFGSVLLWFIMGYLNTVSLLAETSEFSSIIKRAYVRASHTPQSCLVLLPSVSRNFNVAKW